MAIRQYDFNDSLPEAPPDAVLCGFQKVDNLDTEIRSISMYMLAATMVRLGVVKPDGTSITIDDDGTLHSVGGGAGSAYAEPICLKGEIVFCKGDVVMIGVSY